MTRNQEIAETIRIQLGHKCLFMLGAKNLCAIENGLSFQIRGSKKFSHVQIVLNGNDYYDVTFTKCRAFDIVARKEFADIPVENLRELIERKTGLATKL